MGDKDTAKTSRLPSSSGKRKKGDPLEYVEEALNGLRFGQITLIVHDGVVVQIETTEKRRFNEPS
jgi:hypothetical protein